MVLSRLLQQHKVCSCQYSIPRRMKSKSDRFGSILLCEEHQCLKPSASKSSGLTASNKYITAMHHHHSKGCAHLVFWIYVPTKFRRRFPRQRRDITMQLTLWEIGTESNVFMSQTTQP